MRPEITLRLMGPSDLAFADSLRALVGWNQTMNDWRRFLQQKEGCFIAEWNGAPAGTATTTCYGKELAWIGMVLVHPDFRGRGIGKALLNHCLDFLRHRGIHCIKLDATPQGKLLYDRLGFQAEWPLARWENRALQVSASVVGKGLRPPAESDAERLEQLDRRAFGVSRQTLLQNLFENSRHVLIDQNEDCLSGYGLLREGMQAFYLGPLVTVSSESAARLATALVANANGKAVFWDIPDLNTDAVALAKKFGFTIQRPLLRMFLGTNASPGQPLHCFAIADPSIG